jgi:hypothetical protein
MQRAVVMVATIALVAGAAPALAAPPSTAHPVITVPGDAPTIQRAVDAARPGTLILVAPGVHPEAVTVSRAHPDLVIRGLDRVGTVVDCRFATDPGHRDGFHVLADGVAIENLTVRDCVDNAFYWDGVHGYRGSYLTADRTGDYGFYAFGSTNGTWDHDFAQGSPDAGFYIGQCNPCHAVIDGVESRWNGLGYSGTNSGGDLEIVRSRFHDNRAGVVPNSASDEGDAPERGTTIAGNAVYANGNEHSAAIDIATVAQGTGILLAGANDNLVERNRVSEQSLAGIAVVPLPEQVLNPGPHATNFDARGNRVVDNVVRSGSTDLALVSTLTSATDPGANCFARNRHATSVPADLERAAPCGGRPTIPFRTDLARLAALLLADHPPAPGYRDVALPPLPALPGMPGPRRAPARPATHEPAPVRLAAVAVPAPPAAG